MFRNVLLLCLTVAASASYADDKLAEGVRAPAIKVAKWSKGKEVKSFEPGKVYIVEFWATWCGPCLESIPHLAEMAKEYKDKATFVGVCVWDKETDPKSTAYIDRVDKWVKAKHDMDYSVCIDDVEDTMATTWMKAASQNGIPTAFVVDQKGVVVWIGHPMVGLDKVVPKVIAGTFSAEEAKAMREAEEAKQKKVTAIFTDAQALVMAGKVDEGFAKLDEVLSLQPDFKDFIPMAKFSMLVEADEAKGFALGHKYLDSEYKDNAEILSNLGMNIALGYQAAKNPDYALAEAALKRALELTKKGETTNLYALAESKFKQGKKEEAIEVMKRAIRAGDADPTVNDKLKERLKKRLVEFQSG